MCICISCQTHLQNILRALNSYQMRLINWLTMTLAVSIAVVYIPRWTVTTYSAAHCIRACSAVAASAVVIRALVHV